MYQYQGIDDTIVAIATAQGPGAVGIVRLSGANAIAVADQIFQAKRQKPLAELPSYRVYFGWACDSENAVIDEVLVTLMRAPRSYTAEDVVEINCHGGAAACEAVLKAALKKGARLAEPGEFTKRAFLNGRLDLVQAEAVLDLIKSKTDQALRLSTHQLKGELSLKLNAIREQLMALFIQMEAVINFPEDDIDVQIRIQGKERLSKIIKEFEGILKGSHQGQLIREGVRLVLCGLPNAGKSSLLNALLRQERAIISPVAGTTRDVIEAEFALDGIVFKVADTAGILSPRDEIEQEAIRRSFVYIDGADVVLIVIDASKSLTDQDRTLIERAANRPTLVVLNKIDLAKVINEEQVKAVNPKAICVDVSALKGDGLKNLEAALLKAVKGYEGDTSVVMVSNIRQIQALEKARDLAQETADCLTNKAPLEVISETIKSAVNQLDAMTGRNIDDDLIDRIFSEFCIGK